MVKVGSSEESIIDDSLKRKLDEIDYQGRKPKKYLQLIISIIAFTWAMFQLWLASPLPFILNFGIIVDVPARGLHLAFGLLLCFLTFPLSRGQVDSPIPLYDILLGLTGLFCASYLYFANEGLSERLGSLLIINFLGLDFPFEAILGGIGILLLLEATRRAIGLPLVVVASIFLIYSIFGQLMPDLISHKGLSLNRLIGYQWLGGEAIFGIPIDVSVSFVFLFVLFGALLDKAGAGKYFLDLSFALVGRYRGGPAKAAILASGMTGAISGSSIGNVVTTGTFTIPVMKKMGMTATKAGAIEVAASTNGQIMPPIMGAAAFIIAELLGMSYLEVIKAAFIPAVISYVALFYISHLESIKLGLKGMPIADIPHLRKTFLAGVHFLIPIFVLVYLLIIERWTAGTAVFYSILSLILIIVCQHLTRAFNSQEETFFCASKKAIVQICAGLIAGSRNMIRISVAVATAGIIVGAVSSTGLNNSLVGIVEAISGGNVYILLIMTAILCLVLGMGLPTTANYLVVASLLAGVLVELGSAAGLTMPLIAVHLFVFYFGILADDTPPVCLAAFAASAISKADPLKTGIQGFFYDIRTAILPFVFIFNPELLLIGITSFWHALLIFVISLLAILSFSSLTQGWFLVKVKWYESILLIAVVFSLFRPDAVLNWIYPQFKPIAIQNVINGKHQIDPGQKIRLHITRQTDYGDRLKLYVIEKPIKVESLINPYGLTLAPLGDGKFEIIELVFNGISEVAGARYGDLITKIDEEQFNRPAKEWIYPIAVSLLAFFISLQVIRRRRENVSGIS